MTNSGSYIHPSIGAVFPVALWQLQSDLRPTFGVEGVNFDTGPALDWLVDVGLLREHSEIDDLLSGEPLPAPLPEAEAEAALRQLCFVPSLSGLQLPQEDHRASATMLGIRRDTGRAALVRAAVLGIAFQTRMLLERFRELTGVRVATLRCNGGVTLCRSLMQTLADAADVRLEVATATNASLQGVARLAGVAEGVWARGEEAVRWKAPQEVLPTDQSPAARQCWNQRFAWWRRACVRALDWHRFEFEGDCELKG